MALTVRDLTRLQCFARLRLVAGERGLKNKINGVGILDYELMPEYKDSFLETFTPGDFVLCSFLYQYCCDRPEEILPTVRELYDYGAAALGCKDILYPKLPPEVIEFANAHDFPIFQFGKDIYYENITYEIYDALQKDDRNLLTSENIDAMIMGTLPKNRIYTIAKTLSLSFKENARVVYITQDSEKFLDELPRYCRNFYLNRGIGDKAMVTQYRSGMFILLTAAKNDEKTFDILLDGILEYLNIASGFYCCRSRICNPFDSLDSAFRESYKTYLASLAEGSNFNKYDELGAYKFLIGEQNSAEMADFMQKYIEPLQGKPDYAEAAEIFIQAGGDIAKAAERFGCHANTIRYKLARIRELTGTTDESENDFYMNLSLAFKIYKLRQFKK